MPQPDHISKLGVPDPAALDDDLQAIWQKCVEKLGFVPNVYSTYSLKPQRLRNFMAMYNEIMLSDSGLSKLEREMIAVVVSSANRCYYCLVAHGAAVRLLSGDPELGEMMALNYRVAELDPRAARDAGLRLEDDDHALADRRRGSRGARRGRPVDVRYVRPERDRRVLQPVEPHGLGHRHDAESGIPPRRAGLTDPVMAGECRPSTTRADGPQNYPPAKLMH